MRRRIIRHDEAERDIRAIAARIRRDRPQIAKRFLQESQRAFKKLLRLPRLGVSWESSNSELEGLRVWHIRGFENFLIFYRPIDEGIEIIRVLHGTQDIEETLER